MPRGANSAPNDRTSERTAAFVADRMERPGAPTSFRNEVVTNAAAFGKQRSRLLNGEEDALEVHIELRIDLILGNGFQRRRRARPGIREQYVNAAELLADLTDDIFNLGGLAHVAAQHCNAVPELACGRLQPGWILPDDDDGSALLPKQLRRFESNARGSARDDDDFVRQFH